VVETEDPGAADAYLVPFGYLKHGRLMRNDYFLAI
jgi:hypothetical protein